MNGWHITAPRRVEDLPIEENFDSQFDTKVMLTKALITYADAARFAAGEPQNVVPGSYGIGKVSEPGQNLFDLQQGNRVYVSPMRKCGKCYNCNNNERGKCSDPQIAGENFHGFLRNFVSTESNNLYYLPDSVSDDDALYIEHLSLALSVIDNLDVQKGDHIAVIGTNNLGNILAQLLIYYQAVPILIGFDSENLEIARSCGIYYTLGKDDNWIKEVAAITGGRMAKSVVYNTDSDVPARNAFLLAGYNTHVAITGTAAKNNSLAFASAMKKQLVIHCINTAYGYTSSSINLLNNKAVNLKPLKIDKIKYADVQKKLEDMADALEKNEKVYDAIVEISD